MSDFLSNLADTLDEQFSLGENTTRELNLGDLSKKIDNSQQRQYLEQGYIKTDPYNATPKNFEVLFQQPDITVLVKKRAFASLAENFRLDHMDKDEKLFYKATKILFQNKCKQISTFEKLSKIYQVSQETGQLSSLVPLIIGLTGKLSLTDDIISDEVLGGTHIGLKGDLAKLEGVIDKIRKVYAFSNNANYTSWMATENNLAQTLFGQGTGVLELNNVTGISTNLTVGSNGSIGGGGFSLNISDPYNLMSITNYDIEKALADATNFNYNSKLFQFSDEHLEDSINQAKKKLNDRRASRGASAIEFLVNADTLLSKRVRAIVEKPGIELNFTYDPALGFSGIGGLGGVKVTPDSLKGGEIAQEEGLDSSEVSLFNDVISKIFNDLQLKANSKSIIKQNSEVTNYARRKLRLHYGGKLLIQPMDQVHIYINSKSKLDDKISGGLHKAFTGFGFLSDFNKSFQDVKTQLNSLFNPSSDANIQIEKSVFVGSDFPNWLWTLLRNQFVTDTAGAHVFAGLVNSADSSYSDGKYNVSIQGKDNSAYLEMGKVNLKPSIDVFNGPLLDPLTPFKTKFDNTSITDKRNTPQLLQENEELLKANFVKFKAGPNAGKTVNQSNISQDDDIQQSFGSIRKSFYSPDGFIYRWKEGIGTFTQFSNAFDVSTDNNVGFPSVTREPFAGQDVMNVISLAITGIPYNYATFYKAAREVNGYGRDPQTGEDSARSFFDSLTADLQKNNLLWGNFIPFKNLVMDEKSFRSVLNGQLTVLNANDKVDRILVEIKSLNDSLKIFNGNDTFAKENSDTAQIKKRLAELNSELNRTQDEISNQLKDSNQNLSTVGNDVSFDFDEFLNNDTANAKSLSNVKTRKELRRKVNFLTRRLAWQVRANEDKSYLIIDDSYDKDYDIAAFEKALAGPDGLRLFNSDYNTVREKIEIAAKLLNLEVFCDTQGHIRVRPPQYNRIPSSVFYRLLQLKKFNGVQLFPQFIEDLFEDQIQSLINQIEVIEDQIRLDAATLGKNTDEEVKRLIRGSAADGISGTSFDFISDENSGAVIGKNSIFSENDIEQKQALQDQRLNSSINTQAKLKSAFNSITKSKSLNSDTIDTNVSSSTRIDQLKSRLSIKTGQPVSIEALKSPDFISSVGVSPKLTIDSFKVVNDLSLKIAERQKIVKLAANALKNAREVVSLDGNTRTATKLLLPDITPNSEIPEIFEQMLEDENYDDYGLNSSKRYIVKNYQIKRLSIQETPPSFNAVEVKGQLNLFLSESELPQDLNLQFLSNGSSGGNALVTAAAVDYDMWRMYGLRVAQPIAMPFLSDPQSQCAPFAAMLLSRARQDILQGNLEIVGNEFMQPGDVIYLEDKDLLFYVESVSHNFSYGSSFSTTLNLKYGHCPGEYIPTTLDLIGKLLYKNRDASTYSNFRQTSSYNQQSLGVIVLDKRGSSLDNVEVTITSGSYGDHNTKVINDILFTTSYALSTNSNSDTVKTPRVELRIYYDGSSGTDIDTTLSLAADHVKSMLKGTTKLPSSLSKTNIALDKDNVAFVPIDISTTNDFRSPSQKAVDMARSILNSTTTTGSNKLNSVIFGYIIDCWLSFAGSE